MFPLAVNCSFFNCFFRPVLQVIVSLPENRDFFAFGHTILAVEYSYKIKLVKTPNSNYYPSELAFVIFYCEFP